LIAEVATIKAEKTVVQEKVERYKNLIASLSSEKLRWQQASQDFQSQIATMVGDVLISGGFLAYVGFFDFYYRLMLSSTWKAAMDVEGLRFRQEMSVIEFFSKPSQRLVWKSNRLPDDSLCVEHILKRFNRNPLVIDPSLNSQRKRLLLSIRLSGGRLKATTYQRGAAVTLWSAA
jgi:dynein heavy chain 1